MENGSEFRRRVGHTFSPKSMLAEHYATQEKALYAAIVALQEGASLATKLSNHFSEELCQRLLEEAREHTEEAAVISKLLRERRPFSLE